MFVAIVLITVGLAFLALNLGLVDAATFSLLWPLLLLTFGIWILMKGKDVWHDRSYVTSKKKK